MKSTQVTSDASQAIPPSANFEIRAATADLKPLIRSWVIQERLNPVGLKWENFVVATDHEENVVGICQLKPRRHNVFELASLVVAKEARGQGVGRALVDEIKKRSDTPIWLMCGIRVESYYHGTGFRTVHDRNQMPKFFAYAHWLMNLFARKKPRFAIMVWNEHVSELSADQK